VVVGFDHGLFKLVGVDVYRFYLVVVTRNKYKQNYQVKNDILM